jgi:hypothetical protein
VACGSRSADRGSKGLRGGDSASGTDTTLKAFTEGINPLTFFKIAGNLRLENFSSLILMGLTQNSNSRFAIRFWRLEAERWELGYGREMRSAEMGMEGDGGRRVEL